MILMQPMMKDQLHYRHYLMVWIHTKLLCQLQIRRVILPPWQYGLISIEMVNLMIVKDKLQLCQRDQVIRQ